MGKKWSNEGLGCTKLEKLTRESVLHFTAHVSLNTEAVVADLPTVKIWHFDNMANMYIQKESNIIPLRTL